ncbi:MAG TPA: hypothetical protein P5105_00050, partial [Victivallales bacterium]|nr:hypothetical protein [Victivallales bacterium]
MNYLVWIKDLLFGTFTSLAEHFIAQFKEALGAGLSPDWYSIIKICFFLTIWLGSGFFAATVAEIKNRNRLIHFMGGLFVPWIYPFVILFKLEKLIPKLEEDEEDEEISKSLPEEAPEQKIKIEEEDEEEVIEISQAYM